MKFIKKLLIGLILIFFLTSCVYATDVSSSAKTVAGIQNIVHIMYMITWPLLVIAGKALGTDFVYGTAFGMDYSLFALWQMSRTVANFALGFAMLASILGYFWNVEKFNIKSIAPKIVLASIVINASWFILGALLDISIIITMAVGHMGNVFTDMTEEQKNRVVLVGPVIDFEKKASISPGEYKWCVWDGTKNISGAPECLVSCPEGIRVTSEKKDCEEMESPVGGITLGDLEGGSDGLTGPLFGLFRFVNDSSHIGNNSSDEDLIFITAVKLILLIMLIVPLIGLAIVAITRVFMLWLFIGFTPIITGAYILGVGGSKIKERFNDILSIIFMPVVLVFAIVIGLVFVNALSELMPMGEDKGILENLNIKAGENEIIFPDPETVTDNYELLKIKIEGDLTTKKTGLSSDIKDLSRWFGWVLINFLCSIILWVIFIAAMSMNKITKKISGTMEALVKGTAKTAPILPLGQSVASMELIGDHLRSTPDRFDAGRRSKVASFIKEGEKKYFGGKKKK